MGQPLREYGVDITGVHGWRVGRPQIVVANSPCIALSCGLPLNAVYSTEEKRMKRSLLAVSLFVMFAGTAMAYQVTGPVLDVTDTKIVVDKNGEKHEIARDKNTKGDKNIKKGDRVTVQYTMTATEIENKTPAKKDDKKDAKKDDKAKDAPKDGKK
jgi:acetylornithine/succinyldiaminopimelate/putrescine aminotransferase